MAITVKDNLFILETNNSSYIFTVTSGYLEHLYYGKKLRDTRLLHLSNRQIYNFAPYDENIGLEYLADIRLSEYSGYNTGDFRVSACVTRDKDGYYGSRFKYKSYSIKSGESPYTYQPHSRRNASIQTLAVKIEDVEKGIEIVLYYTVFEQTDVIARSTEIKNVSQNLLTIEKITSMQLDFFPCNFDFIELSGVPGSEHILKRNKLRKGISISQSNKGFTSHTANPFAILCESSATETSGEVFGINLIYSGSFSIEVEVDRLYQTRINTGINSSGFSWTLAANQSFVTPEALMCFSSSGIGAFSRSMHDHIRQYIIPKKFRDKRPIVVNTWEAFSFDINQSTISSFASAAKELAIDTVVIDDGWFRRNDNENLGDWDYDREKFPGGLSKSFEIIRKHGLKTGIWFEPEMINANSKLFKSHPEWILNNKNSAYVSRNQLVLDMGNPEVIKYLYQKISQILTECQVDYVKWDANRYLSEVGSSYFFNQGEVQHRYMLGVYELMYRITNAFPNIMVETCAGGGGRFDLGMLFYGAQIWASDSTEPCIRIPIQYSLSYTYPPSALSCHITRCTGYSKIERSFNFRYLVSSFGSLGYELDINAITDSEKESIIQFNKCYKEISNVIFSGDLYRLISPLDNSSWASYIQVSKDKTIAVFTFLQLDTYLNQETVLIKLQGLNPDYEYMTNNGKIYSGAVLMYAGIRIADLVSKHWDNGQSGAHRLEKGGSGSGIQIIFKKLN